METCPHKVPEHVVPRVATWYLSASFMHGITLTKATNGLHTLKFRGQSHFQVRRNVHVMMNPKEATVTRKVEEKSQIKGKTEVTKSKTKKVEK